MTSGRFGRRATGVVPTRRACIRVAAGVVLAAVLMSVPVVGAPAREERLQQGIRALVEQRYSQAESEFSVLQAMDPDDFDALYLRLVTRQSKILDYESYTIEESAFLAYADSVAVALENHLLRLQGPDSVRCLFYIGNVYGGKSAMQAKNDKWLGAISTAFTSVSYLKQVVRRDPGFLPAYLGIGTYNYYLSKNLKWLPLFGDRRSQGIREIQKATRAPAPYDLGAKNLLCWILIENGQNDRADSIARQVLASMPQNTVFLRISTVIATNRSDWEGASALSRRLIEVSRTRNPINWSDLTCGYDALVHVYEKQGKGALLVTTANEALALKIPRESTKIPYVMKHLRAIREARDRHLSASAQR